MSKRNFSVGAKLSNREIEILAGLANGKSTKEIAFDLKISPRTAEQHRVNIMEKLRIRTTAQLTQYALARKIIENQYDTVIDYNI